MSIKVIKEGIATTIQDLGRPGYYHLGIPIGGGMDRYALRAANLLVGNDEGDAVLESVFMGPDIEFNQDCLVAVTGAELPPMVDGVKKDTWTSFKVNKGQVLSFDYLRSGARAYIAISGGINTPTFLGSRSTYVIGALGGVDGRPIKSGDEIPLGVPKKMGSEGKQIPIELINKVEAKIEIKVLPGLYSYRVTGKSLENFFNDTWKVASEADRMGYRFQGGRALEFIDRDPPFGAGSDPSNITDACYPYGSIQVPSGTEPIVLHRDAVSGGGYFMIGTVISSDMDLIGQLQPNMEVSFVKVDMDTALNSRKDRLKKINQIRELLN